MRSEQRAEGLGLALGDARRRLVEQDDRWLVGEHARQVDDPAGAGGELADELGAERLDAHELDELVDPVPGGGLAVHERREAEGGVERVTHVEPAFEGDHRACPRR